MYNYNELSPWTRVHEPNVNIAIKLKNVLDMITKNPDYRGATPEIKLYKKNKYLSIISYSLKYPDILT